MIEQKISFECCEIFEFDAKKIFGVSVSDCLLFIKLKEKNFIQSSLNIFSLDEPKILKKSLTFNNGKFFFVIRRIKFIILTENAIFNGDRELNTIAQKLWS